MKPTVDIIEEILNDITWKGLVKSYVDLGNGIVKILACDTLHVCEGDTFIIGDGDDAVTYTSIDVVYGVSIIFEAGLNDDDETIIPESKIFYAKPLKYFHGTPISVGGELNSDSMTVSSQKLPMLYCYEVIEDQIQDQDSLLDRITPVKLFFLNEANFEDWDTDQSYSNVIKQMSNAANRFVDFCKTDYRIGKIDSYSITSFAKFNIFLNQRGIEKKLFSDNTSGVELDIDLPILKDLSCLC